MKRSGWVVGSLAALLMSVPIAAQSAEPRLYSYCQPSTDGGAERILCEVRAGEPKTFVPSQVTAKIGDTALKAKFENFAGTKRTAAYVFLIQRSAHPKNSEREAIKLLKGLNGQRAFGVYSFSDKLEEHTRLGFNSEADIKRGLAAVTFTAGAPSVVFNSVKEALEKLAGFTADRKALVLFANGKNTGGGDAQAVLDLAKLSHIPIIVIGMAGEDGRELAYIKELAEKSDGVYIDAKKANDLSAFPEGKDFVRDFLDYAENGGTLEIAGKDVAQNARLSIATQFGGVAALADPTDARPGSNSTWQSMTEWFWKNIWLAGAGGVVALGALLLAGTMLLRRRQGTLEATYGGHERDLTHLNGGSSGEMEESTFRAGQDSWPSPAKGGRSANGGTVMDTVIVGPQQQPDRVYAWLQFLDAASTKIPVGATNVRIGRHKDNDICLVNNTVHRQHAVMHLTHDQKFVIRDLGGKNGVKVNDQACNQRELTDGDLIELGEVRMRFVANPMAA